MIQEAYVSFEVALLLKEKGFEQFGCQKQYNTSGDLCEGFYYGPVAPTQQMAIRWLREEKGFFIHIEYRKPLYEWEIINMNDSPFSYNEGVSSDIYNKYEEAVEAALKYVLKNLI